MADTLPQLLMWLVAISISTRMETNYPEYTIYMCQEVSTACTLTQLNTLTSSKSSLVTILWLVFGSGCYGRSKEVGII